MCPALVSFSVDLEFLVKSGVASLEAFFLRSMEWLYFRNRPRLLGRYEHFFPLRAQLEHKSWPSHRILDARHERQANLTGGSLTFFHTIERFDDLDLEGMVAMAVTL